MRVAVIQFDIQKHNAIKNQQKAAELIASAAAQGAEFVVLPELWSTGFDLEKISLEKSLTMDEIIQIHTSLIYDVYAIGFLPAFAYLGRVDEKLATARLGTPRTLVPKGSVAIADNQTAVYPQNSPGGWNIIGKTALELFDKKLDNLSIFEVGNKVKFNSISKEKFLSQGGVL